MSDDTAQTDPQHRPAGGGPVEHTVGRPVPERAEWEHLLRYGYAPGNYMNTCLRCGEVTHGVDKRARCCRPCAEARHAWEQQQRGHEAP